MPGLKEAIEYIGIPTTIGVTLVALWLLLQIVGEISEVCGKVVPEWLKIRKYFRRKKQQEEERVQTLKEVKETLDKLNKHYDVDNIEKRNEWMSQVDRTMEWVHERADSYDSSIEKITSTLSSTTDALNNNTKMTEDMFVENSRDRIIDFAEKASDYSCLLSHEQFRRIERVYNDYEKWLVDHNRTNGEVDTSYELIQDGYKYRMKNHCFVENLKGLPTNRD
jgi:hypothetical protein